MSAIPTIHIVDDDEDVRDALSMFLGTCGLQTRAYASAQEFLQALPVPPGGCVLLDINMPGKSGPELQCQLQKDNSDLAIIFLTAYADVDCAVTAMKNGAVDFLQKPVDESELLECIHRTLHDVHQRRVESDRRQQILSKLEQLTPRESEVLQHLVAGDITKVVADKMGISARTAELHRSRIMKKMDCKNLAQLTRQVDLTQQ